MEKCLKPFVQAFTTCHRRGFCQERHDPGSCKLFLGSGNILKARDVVVFQKITGVSLYLRRKNDNWLKYMGKTSSILIFCQKCRELRVFLG